MTAPEPHPLDAPKQQAAAADLAAVRRALTELPQTPQDPHGWAAGAEETLRAVIGMERKAQMEMRIALEGHLDGLPLRKTAPLAAMTLPELVAEHREGRAMLLRVLDHLLAVGGQHEVRAWTYGEEVPPAVYLLALRGRLERLTGLIAAQRLQSVKRSR
ncbi:hypothetical protein [Deinococcus arcticus]|uniref:Uncharacterized protein n=1 Tax=Deinococcus arcticus TaxID=2136176 RepID=A0A2T3WA92_9DEIO|nr:hypothetical protein [Deinococcus arcticus]PTA68714.1 hypothetical protein C8263_05555 [Deinococcus arcticus]